MYKIISTFTTVLFAMQIQYAQYQLDQFSTNPSEYLSQLEEFMTFNKRENLIEAYEGFEAVFMSGLFTAEEQDTVIAISNKMLSYRMTASPFFENYLTALQHVKKSSEQPEQQFKDWSNILNQSLQDIENKSTKKYGSFLEFSRYFFENQTLRYSKNGTSWSAKNAKYSILYEEQPIIQFETTDLLATRREDSLRIIQTSGRYIPAEEQWIGRGGKVNWSDRFGQDVEVFAEFKDTFSISLDAGLYRVSKALLYYPSYFGERKMLGSFEDKVTGRGEDSPYPAFESEESVLKIDKIGQGIYFTGGFRLNGLTVYGYGTKEQRATLKVYDEKEENLLYKGASELVIIKHGAFLLGDRVESTLYYGQDSIYHPSVSIRFDILKKQLQLKRGDRGSDRNPFFSSAHQMTFDAENIIAYLPQDSIAIGKRGIALTGQPEANFESLKYFNQSAFLKAQNIGDNNPLAIIAVTSEREGLRALDASLIARRINAKFTEENIKPLLYELIAQGFVDYDEDESKIIVKDKLVHYVKANAKKVDYDGLNITSTSDTTNATLNLKNNELTIAGIKYIEFSPVQKVAIIPDDGKVIVKENRDMTIDGKLYAGYSIMEGKGFNFNYDSYNINLDSVELFDLYVPTGGLDENNEPESIKLGSSLEGLNGVLLIDAPSNKSGTEDIEIFPSFQSKQNSYVYYERDEIQQSAYKRDSFYFKLDKFSFNHLDRFTPRDVKFKGELVSFDIFEPFREELVIRKSDQSLGFEHNTPESGHGLYQNRGNFTGLIDLSNAGLLGKGDLTYLGASVHSEDIVFRPYQLTASANTFNHDEDRNAATEVPQVVGIDVKIDWKPYRDSMYVQTEEEAFDLFQAGLHTLEGTLVVSPGGVKGIGQLDWDQAVMQSSLFNFGAFSAEADTTTLKIKALEKEAIALSTSNVNGNVNFDMNKGYFKANDEFLLTSLPYNQYETSMNEFEWDMKEKRVDFKSDPSQLGTFLSIHPDQDSLLFNGQNATYNLINSELAINGVPYIEVSDAFIYPDSGLVKVLPNATLTTLENARIVANTTNKNHVINRATVDILGKRVYQASGFYEYNIGDRAQEITFQDIQGKPVGKGSYKEKQSTTRATGTVQAADSFYIDVKTEFQGTIELSAESKNLFFDGFAKLKADKLPIADWFRVRFEGDKKDLKIQYDEPKNEEGIPLQTGFFLSKETAYAYPSMIAPLYFRKDRDLLLVKGVVDYDPNKDAFIFADSTKMYDETALTGNYLVFNNSTGKVSGEGKFNIGSGLKYINVAAAGTIETTIVPKDSNALVPPYEVTAELMAAIDLIVPDKLMDIMIKDFQSGSFDAKPVNFIREPIFYKKATAELFTMDKDLEATLAGVNLGTLNLPSKQNKHTFVFAKLPLKWNQEYQSFVTQGSRIGLTSIKGELFNNVYKGYVEFRMPTNGDDRLYIYLESSTGTSYYFGFKQGILSLTSTNTAFMQAAEELKAKDIILKMDDGETYEIQLVSSTTANMFVNRAKAAQ